MTLAKKIATAIGAAAAAGLAGCATVPGSVEEQLWFDKATGYDYNTVSPELRFHGAIGYPRTDYRVYRAPPPEFEER